MVKLVTLITLFITPLSVLTACGDDDPVVVENTSSYINDIGGAGEFLAINMNTSDTIKMSGAITLYIGSVPILQSHNGDKIKLCFIPADKYKNYRFSTTFTLHDSSVVKDNYEFGYMLKDIKTGQYQLNLAAIYKDDNNNISAGGTFKLNVKE